jgi:RNA polymerase sigma-70 factor (ECF subfamily)
MALQPETGTRPLEDYRNYLWVLARVQIAPVEGDVRAKLEASDVVQEALLKAHAARDQHLGHSDAETAAWLRRILANTLVDAIRKLRSGGRDVRLEQSLEGCLEQSSARLESLLADEQSSIGEREERAARLFRLSEALAQLPDDQRTAVELMHLHGYTAAAIGEQMGKTQAAVGGLLRRGLKKLREQLAAKA